MKRMMVTFFKFYCICTIIEFLRCRLAALLQEISSEQEGKTIIFVETKKKVEDIARNIRRIG
jgi:superfamily II DNA/RNA helicase